MFEKVLPRSIDNNYRGNKLGLWLLGVVIVMRLLQSTMIIFNGPSTVKDADGVPLDSYPAEAAQNILAVFTSSSLWRATFCLLGVIVLIRYRSATPLMFVILILNFLAAQALSYFVPLIRIGTPPGPYVNLGLFVLMLIGLALSLWSRKTHDE